MITKKRKIGRDFFESHRNKSRILSLFSIIITIIILFILILLIIISNF